MIVFIMADWLVDLEAGEVEFGDDDTSVPSAVDQSIGHFRVEVEAVCELAVVLVLDETCACVSAPQFCSHVVAHRPK